MTHLSPARFRLLMRRHGWTIRTLAIAGGVTQDRIRELREEGIAIGKGSGDGRARTASIAVLNVWGWTQIILRRQGKAVA